MTRQSIRGIPGLLAKCHDGLTQAGFILGSVALAAIVLLFSYEIVMRYFARSPTRWSSDYVAYALLISTFLLLPQLTRTRQHISISFLHELLPERLRLTLVIVLGLASSTVCIAAAYLCGLETLRQFNAGTRTMAVVAVPKWWISIFIVYGLFNSGLYFLRLVGTDLRRIARPGADTEGSA